MVLLSLQCMNEPVVLLTGGSFAHLPPNIFKIWLMGQFGQQIAFGLKPEKDHFLLNSSGKMQLSSSAVVLFSSSSFRIDFHCEQCLHWENEFWKKISFEKFCILLIKILIQAIKGRLFDRTKMQLKCHIFTDFVIGWMKNLPISDCISLLGNWAINLVFFHSLFTAAVVFVFHFKFVLAFLTMFLGCARIGQKKTAAAMDFAFVEQPSVTIVTFYCHQPGQPFLTSSQKKTQCVYHHSMEMLQLCGRQGLQSVQHTQHSFSCVHSEMLSCQRTANMGKEKMNSWEHC